MENNDNSETGREEVVNLTKTLGAVLILLGLILGVFFVWLSVISPGDDSLNCILPIALLFFGFLALTGSK